MAKSNETLQFLDAVLALGRHVLGIPANIRASIATGIAAEMNTRVERQLREMPVDSLRGALPKGTRLGGLTGSSLRTVADIARVAPQTLATVPGVGQRSAAAIHAEALAQQNRVLFPASATTACSTLQR
ncbi:helix-hairpin-helix domain-containing protein [Rhodococcus sp. JS3073]|uniref:helix-hairpin-helix domain-containing protein n=1 Tax=Rhodococcus sp. JS3073 TaxID=3002901 RepID=UPI002285A27A|nr:helix-hairpin-helix domain-containing protein [Rhodococcus sp. JS3073]WAM18332.1 hypothetical protein OYT95_17455 [Rhodococcus sp. JS3073]